MALEDRFRETSEHLAVRLRAELKEGLHSLVSLLSESLKNERDAATRDARQHAEAEAARSLAEDLIQLDRARRYAQAWLNLEIDRARSDAEKQADERVIVARPEGERAGAVDVEEATFVALNAALERLLDAAQRMDEAGSLTETLDILLSSAAALGLRVAAILVHPQDGHIWESVSLDDAPAGRVMSLDATGGIVTDAVASGSLEFYTGSSASTHREFVPLSPGVMSLAVPLQVGGQVVAVLYADDGGSEPAASAAWPQIVELVARHGARCLESLSARCATQIGIIGRPADEAASKRRKPVEKKQPASPGFWSTAGASSSVPPALASVTAVAEPPASPDGAVDALADASARRCARLLVSEIKLYNGAAVTVGRRKRDLGQRLHAEIDRARKLYEERVPAGLRARTSHLDEELVRVLAEGDVELFGEGRVG